MQLLYLNTNDATKVHLAIFKLGVLGRYLPQFKEGMSKIQLDIRFVPTSDGENSNIR